MWVAWQFEMDDLIAGRTLIVPLEDRETAVLGVPVDRLFKVANANACMEEFDHSLELKDGFRYAKSRSRKSVLLTLVPDGVLRPSFGLKSSPGSDFSRDWTL